MNTKDIFAIERPHPNLLKLYFLRSLIALPLFPITFPVLFFRYQTLRYNFDEEGISMRWGILFRREINLTYARIQDIHVHSGVIQRWFGLADLKIQTASGSADAEMTIEGLQEYGQLRDFIYSRMRGYKDSSEPSSARVADSSGNKVESSDELLTLLRSISSELHHARLAMEKIAGREAGDV